MKSLEMQAQIRRGAQPLGCISHTAKKQIGSPFFEKHNMLQLQGKDKFREQFLPRIMELACKIIKTCDKPQILGSHTKPRIRGKKVNTGEFHLQTTQGGIKGQGWSPEASSFAWVHSSSCIAQNQGLAPCKEHCCFLTDDERWFPKHLSDHLQ